MRESVTSEISSFITLPIMTSIRFIYMVFAPSFFRSSVAPLQIFFVRVHKCVCIEFNSFKF